MNMHPRTRRLLREHSLEHDVPDFAHLADDRRNEPPRMASVALSAAVAVFFAIVVFVHLAAAGYALM
jgi:hypothetical protein